MAFSIGGFFRALFGGGAGSGSPDRIEEKLAEARRKVDELREEARREARKIKEEAEQEAERRRTQILELEKRVADREETLTKKMEGLEDREATAKRLEEESKAKIAELQELRS